MAASRKDLRRANEQAVIREIISNGPLSRSQISRNLSLNKVTVSDILNELTSDQKVVEVGTGESTKNGGRRPTLITLNAKYGYFINIDLGPDQIKFMSNYVDGSIQQFTEIKNSDFSIHEILTLFEKQIANLKITDTLHGLLGIAVAFYGIVYQGNITYSPFLKLEDINIRQYLQKEYNVPIVICNEANANALYQRDFDNSEKCQNLICVSLHRGVGAGIILNNNLYTGTNGEAGEIGNMIIRHENKPVRAEIYCSETNVINYIRKISKHKDLSLTMIADLYTNHDPQVEKVLHDFTVNLADIINNVLVAYAPQRVVFVSDLLEAIPNLLIEVKRHIHHLTKNSASLQISSNSKYSTQLGSYSILLREIFDLGHGKIKLAR